MTSVLYDVPGPKAIARNRVFGVITVIVVVAVLAWIVYRLFATGQFSATKWQAFGYSIIWMQIFGALGRTLAAFAVAAVGALALGFILSIGRMSDHAWVRVPVGAVIEVLRAIPVLVLMMLLYYGLPSAGIKLDPYWAVVIALVAYNGSVLAEVLRAGVQSLPRGQGEAGYAIGLRKSGVMRLVLLPQAVRAMLPVIIAQLVVTLKDTALGFIITYNELLYLAKFLGSSGSVGRPIIPMTIVIGAIYIALCLALSALAVYAQRWSERSQKIAKSPAGGNACGVTDTQILGAQAVDAQSPGVDSVTGHNKPTGL